MKKVLLVVLALVLLVSIMPTGLLTIKASAITSSEVKTNIDNLKTTYGYIPGGKVGKDCYAFVTSLCNKFFGHDLPSQKTLYGGTMQLVESSNFNQIGSTLSKGAGNLSEANLKNLFLNSKCGDVVQMSYTRYANQSSNPNKTSKHTLMIYSVSSTGVVFYHSGSSNVYWGTTPGGSQPLWGTKGGEMSWAQLANIFRNSDNGISVYRSKNLNISGSTPNPTPTPTPQTSTTNPDSYPFPSKSVNNTNYKAGTVTANEIKWVQAVLYQFGFLTSSGIDGKFGPNSVAATKNFQSAYGLTADGSAGPNTLNKMKSLWNAKKGTHTHTVVSATCIKPMHCSTCGTTVGNALGHIYSNSCDTSCNRCGTTRQVSHNYKTTITKATLSANGRWVDKCTECGYVYNDLNISRPVTFELSTTTFTYNGKVRTPSVVVKDADGYTISPSNYMVLYSSGRKNVGTYKVFIMMKGKYTGTKALTFKINPAKISSYQLSATSYTYNGKVKTPSVTVKNASGGKLTNGTSYTVTYSTGRKNVGTYKVTIKGKGNYTGTKTLTFKINPKIKLSSTSYTYDGKVKKPSVTVTNAFGKRLSTKYYTVSYSSGRKNVGTYTATVKFKNGHSGTYKYTFKINPPKTTVSKLNAGKKSITVAITKKSSQVTGYQIQYSASKKFTNAKTKTISSYKTTKYTLKSLSAKKTYYVRVRTYKTVGKTKYYSGWSTYKYVKTK